MSVRVIPLFDPAGRPTPFLQAQWRQRGGVQPLHSRVVYLQQDRTASTEFRAAWRAAFPDRQPLPNEPLADRAGRGTDIFWDRLG